MSHLMKECFRWYGPKDEVVLNYIRQAGCQGVFSALHDISYGEIWPLDQILDRKSEIEKYEMTWDVVESVPVHEDIKTQKGQYKLYIDNYKRTLENLSKAGIQTVVYNFMPVLDWVRTNLKYKLEDGAECLKFDPVDFAAFEIYILKRSGANKDYSLEQLNEAEKKWNSMNEANRLDFERSIIDVFPGCKLGLTIDDLRQMLEGYASIDRLRLKEHLSYFLNEIIPVAEECGVRMAIHPDDPPMPIMGLPRILSLEEDVVDLYQMVDSKANGLCFCSGSFSPRVENDLSGMIARLGHRINAVHLRSTQRNEDGSFYEARHLEGSVDMFSVVQALLNEQKRRRDRGIDDWQLCFRPDHGHTIMDDLIKPDVENPGYACLGRMRGLAELRGLQFGIDRMI